MSMQLSRHGLTLLLSAVLPPLSILAGDAPAGTNPPGKTSEPPTIESLKVYSAANWPGCLDIKDKSTKVEAEGEAHGNYVIVFIVKGELRIIEKKNEDDSVRSPLILYLDGNPFPNNHPICQVQMPDTTWHIAFRVQRGTDGSDGAKSWTRIVGRLKWAWPWQSNSAWKYRNVVATVGYIADKPFAGDPKKLQIKLAILPQMGALWVFYTSVLLVVCIFFYLALTTNIIRDESPTNCFRKQFSLSRVQMALWLLVVTICFVFLYFITGNMFVLNAQSLALIGISASTGLFAMMIDADPSLISPRNVNADLLHLERVARTLSEFMQFDEATRAALKAQVAAIQRDRNALAANPAHAPEAAASIAASHNPACTTPLGNLKFRARIWLHVRFFLSDILCEGAEVSLHRLQLSLWTLICAGIYVKSVFTYLAIPEFPETLLLMTGIASMTYLGFKFPQK